MAFKTFREDPRRARLEAAIAARKIIKPEPKVEPKVQVVPEFDPKPKIAKKVEKTNVLR